MKKTMRKAALMRPAVVESAQQIWLAGLGAFGMAGQEGKALFHQLVRRGSEMQKQGKARAMKLVKTAGRRAEDLREDAQAMLGRARLPIERLDKGVSKAMHRLGIPTRGEILELTKRVEALTRAVEKKNGGRAKARARVAKPAAQPPLTV